MNKNYFSLALCVFSLCVFNVEAGEEKKTGKKKKIVWVKTAIPVGKGLEIDYSSGNMPKDENNEELAKIAATTRYLSLTDDQSCGRKNSPTKDYNPAIAARAHDWVESQGHKGVRSASVPVTQWGGEQNSDKRGAARRKSQSTQNKRQED